MIRIGIIGCGRILAAHLEGYKILREAGVEFEITALCSRKEEDALSYCRRGEGPPQREPVSDIPGDPLAVGDIYLSDFQPDTEVQVFTDYRQLIESDRVDAINDFTIHSLHHQIAEHTFSRGKHLLTQKPLAVSMAGARRMVSLAESAEVTFGVFENLRFAPFVRHHAWAFGEQGPAGDLQMALMGNAGTWWAPDLIVAETPWRHQLDEGGGIALDLGPHFFDMIRYIGGCEILDLYGQTEVVESTRYLIKDGEKTAPLDCNADDTFFASFRNENGGCGTLFGSWTGRGSNTLVGEAPVFYGTRGKVSADEIHLEGEEKPRVLSELYSRDAATEIQESHFPMGITNDFALAQLDWIRATETGGQPECSGQQGLLDLACAYAVVESNLLQRRVAIDDIVSGTLREYQRPIDVKYGLQSY